MNSALEKARQKKLELKSQGISLPIKNPIEKARDNPTSLRLAINGNCFSCVGQDHDPNWRDRVRDCPCKDCSLYPVRQFQ